MKFIKTNRTEKISDLRAKLYHKLEAPIDAMWEQLYIASSQPYLIENNYVTIGYCCINDKDCLTQLFLEEDFLKFMDKVIEKMIKADLIKTASLSSNEPIGFNACLSHSKSIKANTLCFEYLNTAVEVNSSLVIELITVDDIPEIKAFYKEQVGMDDTFGYTENLVSR